MAVTIDWATKIISVPKADLGGSDPNMTLNVNTFREWLKDIEDSYDGMANPDTHTHNTEVTVGGVTLARTFEIINGYTITFENGSYRVTLSGANNNILDVANLNSVSIASTNSAGLVNGGFSTTQATLVTAILSNKMITDPTTGIMTIYDSDGTTPLYTAQLYEGTDTSQTYRGQGAERREAIS